MIYDTHTLIDPYVVALSMESKSRREIRAADFDQGDPIEFDVGSPVYDILRVERNFRVDYDYDYEGTSVQIFPTLIRKGNLLRLYLLIDGPPRLRYRNPFANVNMRSKTVDEERNSTTGGDLVFAIFCAIAIAAGAIWIAYPFEPLQSYSVEVGVLSTFAAASVIAVLVTAVKFIKRHLCRAHCESRNIFTVAQ